MDNRTIRICFSFLLFSFVIEANTNAKETITEEDLRQPRVSGRIVKVYSGTRPEPVYCQQEGFQADTADCAVFYRCVKGASNKFTVFRFQCGPGTVYDPNTEVCNFPRSTKRSECGGVVIPSTEKSNENEIEGAQSEIPSPISTSKPIYGESIRETTTHSTAYPWASSNTQNTQKSSSASTAYPWMTTNANKGSPSNKPISPVQPSRQEDDACTTDGFMGDSENCRKFYRCVGNQRGSFIRYEFMCSESTIWDDDAQSCNHPWAVQRRRCGRGNSDGDRQPSTSNQQDNQVLPNTTIQEQLQINYGDKVTQTQTQISHGQVIQNQTQINYGNQPNKAQNSQVRQNQTQISQGSAVSQTQTQINHGDNAVQTQLQIDHTKDSSQSQTQVHETTSRTTTITSNAAPEEQDQGYGNQQNDPEDSEETDSSSNQCTESGFMGDSMNCKKFYRCVDNGKGGFTKYEFTCGEGTVWDSSIEACNHEWAVKKCGGKVPQSSPEYGPQSTTTTRTTTTTAKTTQNYQPTSESTTDEDYDTGYGNQNQQSETSLSSTATSITTLQPSSAISTSGPPSNSTECQSSGFMGDANDCSKFYRCVDNGKGGFTKYEFKCGEGTVWDPEIDACNHPWAVKKCGGSSTDVNKVETTTGVGTTQAITSVSLVQTTTQASSENVDYDSGYGQQQSESSSSSTSTTKQPQAGGSNDDNKCQSSGFMGDENDCSKFYRCVDNGNGAYTRYEFKCGEGTVWDPKIEACNHPWAVEKCGGSNSGDINKELEEPVPSQTMSDEQTGTTGVPEKEIDKPTQSPATSVQTTEQPKPTKPPIGNECSQEGFMGDKSDCKKFYRCVNDGRGGFIKYEFSCGDGTVWDSEQNTCNHENSVKNPCSSSTSSQNENVSESSQESTTQAVQTTSAQSTEETNTTEKTSTTTKPSSGKECQQEGFVGDEYDCKKFYRCVDNGRGGYIRYEFSCGEGTVWDPELNTCNHPSGDNRCGGTGNQPSSTQPDRENDEPITDATSSTTQSSTEQSQATTAAQKPIPSSDTCTSEGFFGDSKDCKKFYRCVDNGKGGYTKYDFNCGDGTIWDDEIQACNHEAGTFNCTKNSSNETQTSRPQTESTDDGSSTTSSSTEGQESTQKTEAPPAESSGNCTSEGFYANQNDCRKFYRCVSNDKRGYTRYDFSCGEGTRWVQEIQACDHDTGEMSCGSQNTPVSSTTESTTSTSHQSSSTTSSSTTLSSTATQKPVKEDDEYSSDTSSQPPSSSSDDKCTSEGFYPNKNDCRQFYRCVDNGNGEYTKYDFTCGEGTAWDSEVETCNHISEVKNCQGDSQSQPMQDEETSQSPGSSTTESTTNSSTSGSTTENTKPSQDTCKQEGYFGNTQDCTKFYRCVDNGNGGLTKYDFSCGEGTIWDQDVLTCNHPQYVNNPSCQQSENNQSSDSSSSSTSSSSPTSSSSSTTSSSSSSSSTTESSGSADCSQGSTKKPANSNVNCTKAGYYPDPDDCKKFYRCVDWDGDGKRFSVYHFDCGEGTIWDPALDTCNHEDSVYPPRDCSGGSQSQNENIDQESTTTTTEGTTTEEDSKTTEQTTQESTASEQTTQQSSNEQTTTEQNTTSEQTTEQSTTQQGSEEHSTTEQTTNEQTTTQQSTTEQTNEQESTTKESTTEHSDNQESTTKESSNTEESTTQESTEQSTTEQSTTEQSTTEQSITEQSTTEQSTTEHSTTKQSTTEQSTTEQSTTEQTTTTQSTTEQSTTEQSTTEQSTTEQTDDGETTESEKDSTTESEIESSTENGEVTTESSSSSDKDCPETEDDQNLFVCPTSFRRHPKYCNMFYQCTEDDDTHDVQIATFRCPNNTIYDESKTKCVEEKKADKKCDGEIAQKRRVKRLDSTHKEPIIVTNERLKCPAAGHYPFEKEECSPAFLKCQKTKSGKLRGYVYQCPPNHVYWSVSRRCEPKGHLRDCKRSYNNWNGRWEIPVERRNIAP